MGEYNYTIEIKCSRKEDNTVKYNRKMTEISSDGVLEISVRELCELAFRGGDIDNRYPPRERYRAFAEGIAAHRKLMESRGDEYHSEVAMKNICRYGDITFCVSGRADGIFVDDLGGFVIEEIKSVSDMSRFAGAREADIAQLICYGYFLTVMRGVGVVTLRLTYVERGDSDEELYSDTVMSATDLKAAYLGILERAYFRASQLKYSNTVLRDVSKKAVFPYTNLRAAQNDMIKECWQDMRVGKIVFAQAPTGIGKTISTLYPAVRVFGEGRADKIFYLTAKSSTRREAYGAAEKLIQSGTPMRTCVISSRESACINDAAKLTGHSISKCCNPVMCPFARGYYDRAESVIRKLLSEGNIFSAKAIREAAKEAKICPYELALDISELCEIIICDYNYAFSPSVYLRRYFADGIPNTDGHKYIFLVDEAHNLVDRARDMYSGVISLSAVCRMRDAFIDYENRMKEYIFPDEDAPADERLNPRVFEEVIACLRGMSRHCEENKMRDDEGMLHGFSLIRQLPVELCSAAETLGRRCDGWLRRNAGHELYGDVEKFAADLRVFRTAGDYYDDKFVTFTQLDGEDVTVRYQCLDPSGIMNPLLRRAHSAVLFSATLTPADYFADVLGGGDDAVKVSYPSPFPRENLCLAAVDGVSTRFEDREKSARAIVGYIAATVSAKAGNYIVYFPSYSYMEKVHSQFVRKYPNVKTVLQRANMTYAEREEFINSFKPDSDKLQIGFCVLGGSFSEGVDLPGKALIGSIIVGVGLPGLSSERNIMREYFDSTREGIGYDYAYTYPGMNNVLQAAGRVIRRDDDRGIVVIIDDRYSTDRYLPLYPDHWRGNIYAVGNPQSLYELASRFWHMWE